MNVIKRAKAPTPKFFKVLRSIGLALLAIGGTVATAPVSLPAVVVSMGGYMAVAGGILSAVSQVTVDTSADSLTSPPSEADDNNLNRARDGY